MDDDGLRALTERVDALERRAALLEDRAELENLVSRYQYYYSARLKDRILSELWARRTDGITMEDRFYCVYENVDGAFPDAGISTYYDTVFNLGSPSDCPGKLSVCTTTTQVLEVGADRRTAKGVWISIGVETDAGDFAYPGAGSGDRRLSGVQLTSRSPDGKRYMADWVWQKYGVDFLREEGRWKLWHFHVYDLFRCPYGEDWVRYSQRRPEQNQRLAQERCFSPYGKPPGQGTTFHWEYSVDSRPPLEPRPPEPYGSFDETFRY